MGIIKYYIINLSPSTCQDLGMRAANCLEALVRCGNAAALGCQEVAVTGLMGQFEAKDEE